MLYIFNIFLLIFLDIFTLKSIYPEVSIQIAQKIQKEFFLNPRILK